jgi:ABC-2 type transport system permease protein
MPNKILHIAKWEFIEKVKTKAFMISLVMMPMIIAVFSILPGLLVSKSDEKSKMFGIIDRTGQYTALLGSNIEGKYRLPNGKPNYSLVPIVAPDTAIDHLVKIGTSRIFGNEIEGLFVIPSDIEERGKVEFRSENVGNIRDQERFSKSLSDIITQRRLEKAGFDAAKVKSLLRDIDVKTIKISEKGEEKESGFMETFFSGYIFIMMLMFLVITSGQMLVRSVVEEKSSRIVEVLISSCSSKELMSGKILGLTMLGFAMMSFWVLILVGVNLSMDKPFVSFDHLALMLTYFVLGYLFFAAVFVATGAPLSTEQEAQQVTSYVSIILVFPIALAVPAMQNPDSMIVKILSLIPFLTPTMMTLRLSIQTPALWEIVLSILLLSLSTVGMMWAASKIFRIGILVTGKKPNLREIWRWVRTE